MGPCASSQVVSTPSELKYVVDSFPKKEDPYTERNRDFIIDQKHLIVDSKTADSVVTFLFSFSFVESRCHSLQTKPVHDLIINHIAPHVKAIYEFGGLISNIVKDQQSADFYTNAESFAAILKCFHRSKTSEDAHRIASSINSIFLHNPFCNKFLNSLPVVEAFSFIIPLANDADAVHRISEVLLKILDDNEELLKKFGTPEFFKIFQGLEKHATTSAVSHDSLSSFKSAAEFLKPIVFRNATSSSQLKFSVDSLPRNTEYYTEEIRDLLVAKKELIVDAATADSVTKFLVPFADGNNGAGRLALLRTNEVQDLIISYISLYVKAIEEFGGLIYHIVRDKDSAELFANIESFAAILKCFHRSKTAADALWIAASINNILYYNPSSNKLLNSLPVVEAFSFIIPLAKDVETVECILESLLKILKNNEEAQKKFGTPAFLKIFHGMKEIAVTAEDAKASLKSVHEVLRPVVRGVLERSLLDSTSTQQLTSALESIVKQRDRFSSLIDLLLEEQRLIYIQDGITIAIAVVNFIKWFGEKDSKSIARKEIFEMIENVLIPKLSNDNTESIFDALAVLFKEEFARNHFAKTSFRDFVSSSLPTTSGNSFLKALDVLLSNSNPAKEIFGTPEFKSKFIIKFRGNTSTEYNNIIKILDEALVDSRFRSLKKLSSDHKSSVDEEVLRKLAEQEIDERNIHALSDFTSFGFSVGKNVQLNDLVDKVRKKRQIFVEQIFDSTTTSVEDLAWSDSFRNQELLQEIINNKNKITSSEIAMKVAWFFAKFAATDEGRKMATSKEVYGVVINHCSKQVTTTETVRRIAGCIGNVTSNNPAGQRLFSTPEIASYLIGALQNHDTTPKNVEKICFASTNIALDNPAGQRLFSTPETVAAFSNALQTFATTAESIQWLSSAVLQIADGNPAGLNLFATNEFIASLKSVEKYATTEDSREELAECLKLLEDQNNIKN
jgi:hypothetical protein